MSDDPSAFAGAAATRYDEWYRTPWGDYADARERALFLAMARPRSGERALDVGCGTGRYLRWLLGMGLDAFGAELSPNMLEVASARLLAEGVSGKRLVAAHAEDLPFADGTFDLLLAVTVLEFVDDERHAALNRASPYGRQIGAGEMGETLSRARLHTVEELVGLLRDTIAPERLTWRTCLLGPKVDKRAGLVPQKILDALPGARRLPWGAYVGLLAQLCP